MKMAKSSETCDNLCDMERYAALIWACQHLTSSFQIKFEIQTL